MKNFPIIDKETEREYWISRSIAVVAFIFAKDYFGVEDYVLAVQRGTGTPDPEYVGTYCVPCGYLDFDETLVQAAAREVKEETGLTIPTNEFKLVSINDDPNSDKRQNVTFRYVVNSNIPVEDLSKLFTTKNSEENEVSDVKFIKIEGLNWFKWAFNHEELIKEIYSKNRERETL